MAKQSRGALPDAVSRLITVVDEARSHADGSRAKSRNLRKQLDGLRKEIEKLSAGLDPVRQPSSIFDPANPLTIGRFVGLALVAQELHPLRDVPKFYGSGVYALYYRGNLATYAPISGSETPIYIGKSDPAIPTALSPREQGEKLSVRLNDHAKSIAKAKTSLNIEEFFCRYLVVQSGWQSAAEYYLISTLRPVWNSEVKICYGFGKHGDSADTRGNKRSPWDTLHPGRESKSKRKVMDAKPKTKILSEIENHFATAVLYPDMQAIFRQFLDDLKQ